MRGRATLLALVLSPAAASTAQTLQETGRIPVPADFRVGFTAISPDGSQLTAACSDRKLHVWALPKGQPVRALAVRSERVAALVYSNDGRRLAAGTDRGTLWVFRTDSGEPTQQFEVAHAVQELGFSPDGSLLAVALADSPGQLWELSPLKLRATLTSDFGGSAALAFSADGSRLATADEDTAVRVYDGRNGRLQWAAQDLLLESFALGFTPDGSRLVVSGADKTVTLLDPARGKVLSQLPKQPHPVGWLVVLPDGKSVVAGSFREESMSLPGPTLLWNLESGQPRVLASDRRFNGGGLQHDGRLLLTSLAEGSVVLWSLQ